MPDQDGGKLARVVSMEWNGSTLFFVKVGDFQSDGFVFKKYADKAAEEINAAVSRLVEEERKKVLQYKEKAEMFDAAQCFEGGGNFPGWVKSRERDAAVKALEMVIKEIGADSGFPELASTIRALLSRLEGEGTNG